MPLHTRLLACLASFGFVLLLAAPAFCADPVVVRVNATSAGKPWSTAWAFVGYDEPNYTYMPHGRKLLRDLSNLSPVPVYIRTHNLLTSGDGSPALKWGSTNAYTEDSEGRPVYDWRILDRIFDTYRDTRTKPLVEMGFMPEALSRNPVPYRHRWPEGPLSTGWAHPPKDYGRWAELVHQWVRHAVERYGKAEVDTWYWEVWNEPDISYWRGTPEEYHKLYDYAADAVKRALPTARVGGPHTTGPGSAKAAEFLRGFLDHCVRGENHATGKRGAPLDFIAFHAKGNPRVVDGRVRMGLRKHLLDVARGFEVVASFPELRGKPVIIGESDPEGCAACSARLHPQNAYRNDSLYASYTAAMYARTLDLAERYGVRLEGSVTWAFEFEDQPWFDGLRTLATNGVAKPVLNLFRMLGLMRGERVAATSTAASSLDDILRDGVPAGEVSALGSRAGNELSVLLWNYHDDQASDQAAEIELRVEGLASPRVLARHFRIDQRHSNSYQAWKRMGSPQKPSAEQYQELEAAGELQAIGSPQWIENKGGSVVLRFTLPPQSVSLVQMN